MSTGQPSQNFIKYFKNAKNLKFAFLKAIDNGFVLPKKPQIKKILIALILCTIG